MMRMSSLCRKASRILAPHKGDTGQIYMCRAAEEVLALEPGAYKFDTKIAKFRDLLEDGGIESMSGALFKSYNWEFWDKHAQPIRFMYLNFLALYLESEGH